MFLLGPGPSKLTTGGQSRGDMSREVSRKAALTAVENRVGGQPGSCGGNSGSQAWVRMWVPMGMMRSGRSREVLGSRCRQWGESDEQEGEADGGDQATEKELGLGEPAQGIGQGNTRETLKDRIPRGINPAALMKLTAECGNHDPDSSQMKKPLEMQHWAQSDSLQSDYFSQRRRNPFEI